MWLIASAIVIYFFLDKDAKSENAVIITGEITNHIGDTVKILAEDTTYVTVLDTATGKFSVEFELDSSAMLSFFHGLESGSMYANPGEEIHITIDTEMFDETLDFTGSKESSFLAWEYIFSETNDWPDFMFMPEEELSSAIETSFAPIFEKLAEFKESNPSFYENYMKNHDGYMAYINQRREILATLPQPGEDAIDFSFPDRDGNEVSLSSLVGNVVFVDVWAAWCGPCRAEMPALLVLEEEYHDKGVTFLGVNVDEEPEKGMAMIDEKGLKGTHIFTSGWKTQFMQDYAINGIPRFMVFDKEGKVAHVDSPRPSSDEIRPLLDSLLED